jgi:hypothetical protein
MNEFIKIGDVANLLSSMKNTTTSSAATPTGKKSVNGLAIIAGILVVGIVGYEMYLLWDRQKSFERKSTHTK